MRILFKNATIVSMNAQRDIIRGDLLVEDSRISAVGRKIEQPADRVIDVRGDLLIPGLIQTHIHLCQTLFRGQADDLELLDWLKLKIWPLEGAHDPESLYDSALLGIGELFLGGTTAIVDMETVHHTEHAFKAILDSGMRAVSGKCMMDDPSGDVPPSLQEKTSDSLQESVDLYEKYHGAAGGRLEVAFTPRFVISCTDDLLREVSRLAKEKKALVHTHASENRGEIEVVESTRGLRNIVCLEKLGLTGPNLILAHCIWLDEAEKEILVRSKTRVAHCPSSNLKLASGIAPIPELLSLGAEVSLAADGAPCNNNLDGFVEMRHAALIQKPLHGPTVMPAWKVFELATREERGPSAASMTWAAWKRARRPIWRWSACRASTPGPTSMWMSIPNWSTRPAPAMCA